MADILNPGNKDIEKFNRALQTKRAQTVPVWRRGGQRMQVKALGHLHPDQFRELVAPTEYSHDWDLIAHEPDHPLFDRAPGLRQSRDMFVGNVEYDVDDLVKSVREHGVLKPVIVSKQQTPHPAVNHETLDWQTNEQGNVVMNPKHIMIDGHHRAYAALRAGRTIPVWTATEEQINLR